MSLEMSQSLSGGGRRCLWERRESLSSERRRQRSREQQEKALQSPRGQGEARHGGTSLEPKCHAWAP